MDTTSIGFLWICLMLLESESALQKENLIKIWKL